MEPVTLDLYTTGVKLVNVGPNIEGGENKGVELMWSLLLNLTFYGKRMKLIDVGKFLKLPY
jgi:hypothetical protein